MIGFDEEALICDLAETYQIYDYKQLPLTKVAVLAVGLRDCSRIKMKLSGQNINLNTLLLAGAVDRLSILVWSKTKDGKKGMNRPPSLVDSINSKKPKDSDVIVFNSSEDFEKTRNEIIKGMPLGGEN